MSKERELITTKAGVLFYEGVGAGLPGGGYVRESNKPPGRHLASWSSDAEVYELSWDKYTGMSFEELRAEAEHYGLSTEGGVSILELANAAAGSEEETNQS